MPDKERVLSPASGYDIQLKIKDLDYTNDLRSVRIVSTINTAYQIINLAISLDPNDIILDDIMGKEPLKLSIRLLGRKNDNIPLEDIQFELQHVKDNFFSPTRPTVTEGEKFAKERVIVQIICVCRKPFKTMTSLINDVFMEKTPKEVLQSVTKNIGAELIYDNDDENKDKIDQIVLPPTTLYNTIRYIDDYFGLFNGASNLGFCQYDNVLHIQNLTKRMKKKQTFTIYQLTNDGEDNKKIIDKCNDGKYFYTYGALKNQYQGSAKFAARAKTINYIVKPKDELFNIIEQDLLNICNKYGAISGDPEIRIDTNINERESYNIFQSGNDKSEIFSVAHLSRQIIGLTTVEVVLEKNMHLLNLIQVGEPVKLDCGTLEYVPLSGKYILKSSDIRFTRSSSDWVSSCILTLSRTNQYI